MGGWYCLSGLISRTKVLKSSFKIHAIQSWWRQSPLELEIVSTVINKFNLVRTCLPYHGRGRGRTRVRVSPHLISRQHLTERQSASDFEQLTILCSSFTQVWEVPKRFAALAFKRRVVADQLAHNAKISEHAMKKRLTWFSFACMGTGQIIATGIFSFMPFIYATITG